MQNFTSEEEELCDRVFQGPIDLKLAYSITGKEITEEEITKKS
jgi:hypothetical protein